MAPKNRFIHTIKSQGGGKDTGLSIVILCSNPGYRMRSFGPQCLIKDKYGVSILEHQVEIFNTEFNKNEIIIVGGFEVDKIIKNRPKSTRVIENQNYENSNDICDLRLAIANSTYENLLIVYGDMYFSPSVLNEVTQKSMIIVDENNNLIDDDVGTTVVDDHITIMSLSIKSPKWGKIAYFTNKEVKLLRQFALNRDNERMFLFEGINNVIEKGGEFKAKKVSKNEILVHVDSSNELKKIQ
jgi:hypothetical protein